MECILSLLLNISVNLRWSEMKFSKIREKIEHDYKAICTKKNGQDALFVNIKQWQLYERWKHHKR